jgi:hypothetical protein
VCCGHVAPVARIEFLVSTRFDTTSAASGLHPGSSHLPNRPTTHIGLKATMARKRFLAFVLSIPAWMWFGPESASTEPLDSEPNNIGKIIPTPTPIVRTRCSHPSELAMCQDEMSGSRLFIASQERTSEIDGNPRPMAAAMSEDHDFLPPRLLAVDALESQILFRIMRPSGRPCQRACRTMVGRKRVTGSCNRTPGDVAPVPVG